MKLLATSKPFVGMIHLAPLAGSVGYARQGIGPILDLALRDLEALEKGGVDAVLVENFGDTPFAKTAPVETVAMMTAVVLRLADAARVPLGVNVLAQRRSRRARDRRGHRRCRSSASTCSPEWRSPTRA